MRTLTTAEETALGATARTNGVQVEVQNGDGTWIDYSDWFLGLQLGRTIDQPIASATVTLRRDKEPATQYSLAPFVESSDLNVLDDGTTYSPAIDLGRLIRISLATVAAGSTPSAGDYHEVFRGYVDDVDPSKAEMTVMARDLGAHLADRFIEDRTTYGSDAGTDMEDVIQSILTDWTDGVTLYSVNGTAGTPFAPADTPAYDITTTPFDGISVWEAINRIAQKRGWVVRYRWNASVGAYVLTLYEPDRAKSTADWTHGPDRYLDVTQLQLRIEDIRNAIGGSYVDTDGARQEATVRLDTDADASATSRTKYGRRYMEINEPPDSPIDTLSEWQTLADAALLDLMEPEAEQEIETLLFWPVELEDLYTFTANDVHYDTDQTWAIVGYTHEVRAAEGGSVRERTRLRVRGSVAGMYRSWIRYSGGGGADVNDLGVAIAGFAFEENTDLAWSSGGVIYRLRVRCAVGRQTHGIAVSQGATDYEDVQVTDAQRAAGAVDFLILSASTGLEIGFSRESGYDITVTPYSDYSSGVAGTAGPSDTQTAQYDTSIPDPTNDQHPSSKKYVDDGITISTSDPSGTPRLGALWAKY